MACFLSSLLFARVHRENARAYFGAARQHTKGNSMSIHESDSQGRRTRRWHDDEYMLVDGMRVVYSVDRFGAFTVRLPGRISTTVEALRTDGHKVVMPKRVRLGDFTPFGERRPSWNA